MDDIQKLRRATYHLYTFTISKLISTFGAQVYAFAISFYILQQTGSATSFATNLICNILPRTLVSPFAGYMADRYSRKTIIICAQLVTTAAIGGLLFVSLTYGLSLIAIYFTTCVLAMASSFSTVTFSSSITGLVDQARIQRAMSLNQMAMSFAAIGSPAVGGLLYGAVSMELFLGMFIVASFIAVILESTMNFKLFSKRKDHLEDKPKEKMWQSMKAGLAYLKTKQVIMVLIWISLIINFLFGAFEVGYSYILIEKFKMTSQHFGFTQGAFAIGMLVFSIYFSIRKEVKYALLVSKRGILGMGVIMGGISIPLIMSLSYWSMFAYYLIIMFSFGAMIIIVNTPIQVMMQKMIDDDYKGRVFSIIETMAMALMPLGMIIFGFLYDVLPGQYILLTSASILVIVVLTLARPSVVRKAHPELALKKAVVQETGPAL
ncbi:MFS family permease [Bacillus mesophilus]|uniref:MFS transporter n=1 Tax=Bacillus mesophilus TaxID=1808955 RepID=A0A6M0QAW6_9BACI|nr:MFS transporter [Bacillus mesophilus]MBM7662953.1 MFS family permease [Bacillus mesophilus]NEY73541.1 MFS transporter [Bacillus mesophilus]